MAGVGHDCWLYLAKVCISLQHSADLVAYIHAPALKLATGSDLPGAEAVVGITVAHASHLLSVLVLYRLTRTVFPVASTGERSTFAFLAAILHVLTPGGIFLSAPYAESTFSFLNLSGFLLYAESYRECSDGLVGMANLKILISGLFFGVATTFRTNGLLSGAIFVYDAAEEVLGLLQPLNRLARLRKLFFVICGGTFIALGTVVPQSLAYSEYCMPWDDSDYIRPWCSKWIPSIYNHVQSHYWYGNVL